MEQDARKVREDDSSRLEEKGSGTEPAQRRTGDIHGLEKEEEVGIGHDGEQDSDVVAKPKKSCLLCKDCGMVFNRRETFNLHRHFHAHRDELTPLTCKECGLTFQHRSGLIKHRNEHKEKEELLLTPKKEPPSEEGSFKCAECEALFYTVDSLRDHSCCSSTTEKPYHCPLCRQDFQFKVSVSKHMISHSQECVFKCQECSQTFPDSVALRYHQRCHTALKPYKCPECGRVFKHYSVMEDHRRRHVAGARPHLCTVCGKAFRYGSLLHQHQYLHTGQKPFRCLECGKRFAFAQNMKAHCRQHRLNQRDSPSQAPSRRPPAQEPLGGKEPVHQGEEGKGALKCPRCPQTFTAAANLRAHVLVHEAERSEKRSKPPIDANKSWDKGHACTHCPCVFRDEKSLNSHLLSSHKCIAQYLENMGAPAKLVPPANCGGAEGKWRHDGAKSHKCSECGKFFRFRSVLELHMRMHSKDKPYQCKVCGKAFRFSSYLQQHLIIHTGQKPFSCPHCGKDFAFLQNMRTHQKLHQEKPFRCTSCSKGYSDAARLQQHMLSHNGDKPHKCGLCSKSFGLAYLLRDHINTHTGERPHRCEECHKSFSWFSSLLVHRKIHARKRQGFSQSGSSPAGAGARGRGNRGKPGSGQGWASPREPGDAPQASLHPAEVQKESSAVAPPVETQPPKEPIRWRVDGGEVMPVSAARRPGSEPSKFNEKAPSGDPSQDKGDLPSLEPPRLLRTALSSASTSTLLVPTSSSQQLCTDGAALWSLRPPQGQEPEPGAPVAAQTRPDTPPKKGDGKVRDTGDQPPPPTVNQPQEPRNGGELPTQWALGLAVASSSGPAELSSATPAPAAVPHGGGTTLWAIQTPPGVPKSVNVPEKSGNAEILKHISAGWVSVQGPAGAHNVPISIQYDPHRLGQQVWGFQSNPLAQALLTTQLKPGSGPELQQQPIVTGTQIIIKQPSPFFSPPLPSLALPGPHPLHSVPVSALSRPPHPNIFFTPQAVMVERPHLPQTLPLPQLPPRTEPPKLGPSLPFAPDRLLQCMICGCSLPRELDLQMHYLQHAQGEI